MKKTLVAIAVSSAALTSVSAFAAEDTVNFDVYGNIQLVYADSDSNDSEITDNGSTFGFQGSTAISDDLTGFFKYELEADADEKTSDIDVNLDQAYVGLQGGFGKVQVGSFDSIYNNAIQDTYDQFEYYGVTNAGLTDEGDTIAYFSPSMGGFEVQLSAQFKGKAETEVSDGTTEDGTALTAVVKYSVDALTIAAGYDSLENDVARSAADSATYGVSATFQATPALSVGAKWEEEEDENTILGLAARFNYGAGDVYGTYQNVDPDAVGSDDYNEYGVGATYNLASNMYVYGEFGQTGSSEDDITAVGATYLF
ncbi:porin [Marinomonas ostreistagni]|uniref:Porin n=1 Tax=Marinomonas ostreistagni TaxID=359209 RepID=A0ABS0Z6L0_9GAMM|nr:porin [Marinomonas ostreistagni]MBJ7549302.1 porin [Marinomonas ostreistagni]